MNDNHFHEEQYYSELHQVNSYSRRVISKHKYGNSTKKYSPYIPFVFLTIDPTRSNRYNNSAYDKLFKAADKLMDSFDLENRIPIYGFSDKKHGKKCEGCGIYSSKSSTFKKKKCEGCGDNFNFCPECYEIMENCHRCFKFSSSEECSSSEEVTDKNEYLEIE